MLFSELPVGFPWYDRIEQQDRYNENVEPVCDYKLISPVNALLPFEFILPPGTVMPTIWEILRIDSNAVEVDISAQIGLIRSAERNGKTYFYYDGAALEMLLPAGGYFYSRLTFAGGIKKFSEMFYIPGIFFLIADNEISFLRIVWYNQTDLRPIFYNDLVGCLPFFKNVAYLDTFITASEPEIEVDGEKDGNDVLIPTFQKMIIPYRITVVVPDFLKRALMLMQMHDTVIITTKQGIRSGAVENITVTSALEANGGLSTVDIVFQEDLAIVKKGCGENMI
jgi:hypothetical protein